MLKAPPANTESERLDWLIAHPDQAEFIFQLCQTEDDEEARQRRVRYVVDAAIEKQNVDQTPG